MTQTFNIHHWSRNMIFRFLSAVAIVVAVGGRCLAEKPVGPAAERTPRLAEWEGLKYGMFIHFGMSTFDGVECNEGKSPSTTYAPTRLDVRQWVRTAKQAGMKYAVLTAKHISGHCLWESKDYDYDVATSGDKTDVVAEFMKACQHEGHQAGPLLRHTRQPQRGRRQVGSEG